MTSSSRLDGARAVYTLATAAVGLVTTVWLMGADRRDAPNTGLVQASSSAPTGSGWHC